MRGLPLSHLRFPHGTAGWKLPAKPWLWDTPEELKRCKLRRHLPSGEQRPHARALASRRTDESAYPTIPVPMPAPAARLPAERGRLHDHAHSRRLARCGGKPAVSKRTHEIAGKRRVRRALCVCVRTCRNRCMCVRMRVARGERHRCSGRSIVPTHSTPSARSRRDMPRPRTRPPRTSRRTEVRRPRHAQRLCACARRSRRRRRPSRCPSCTGACSAREGKGAVQCGSVALPVSERAQLRRSVGWRCPCNAVPCVALRCFAMMH
jgi:hypothetical protein